MAWFRRFLLEDGEEGDTLPMEIARMIALGALLYGLAWLGLSAA